MWSLVGYIALLLAIVVGQLIRLPFSPGAGIALRLADPVVGLLVLVWFGMTFWRWLRQPRWPLAGMLGTDRWLLAVQVILALTYLLNLGRFTSDELVVGGAYLLRLQGYLSLYWVAKSWFITIPSAVVSRYWYWAAVVVAVVGFIQLVVFPDLQFLLQFGWDPHVGRLVSTFFDPNFVAIFLGSGLIMVLAEILFGTQESRRWYLLISVILLAALYFTYSRSGILSTAVAATLVGFRHSWRAGLTVLVIFTLMILSPGRLGGRFGNALEGTTFTSVNESGNKVTGIFSTDETGNQRILSWQRAAKVIRLSPIYGVGYNNFAPATAQVGVLRQSSDLAASSAQSSDSSLLSIWATTGLVGLIAWLGLGLSLFRRSFFLTKNVLSQPTNAWVYGYGGGLVALSLDSFLINSLLYPQLLIFWLVLGGYIVSQQGEN